MSVNTNPIKIIGASAGTGKTTRLAREFVERVSGRMGESICAERILVSTFTIKAAEELTSRIREKLLEGGDWTSAQLVRAGYVGTVNSICGKILQDYALEGGLSPIQNVIPEEMERVIFSIAADPIIDIFAQELDEISARLSFDELPKESKFAESIHWTSFVADICRLARANKIDPKLFGSCAERSWEGLELCLPLVYVGNSEELDQRFLGEVDKSIQKLELSNDSTKKTQGALEKLREVHARSKRMTPSWYDWAVVAKTEVSQASSDVIRPLLAVASLHPQHPRLRDDLQLFIRKVFACAAEALQAYQDYKMAAGLVDFTDQEYRTLALLGDQGIRDSLSSRIELALIDEFQDTSPIQLALFLELAALVKGTVWVGDTKQAIYGFRGTDPQLMQAATRCFSEGKGETLEGSYRSRPGLVAFSNDVFSSAFSAFGFSENEVIVRAKRTNTAGGFAHALELWRCNGQKLSECHRALALGVNELLSKSENTNILDKASGKSRQLRGADIAILCRANDRAESVAQSLSEFGLKVAITREGLLETPECILALAAMKFLLDKNDTLALAEMIHLSRDYSSETQDKWFSEWLKNVESPDSLFPHSAEFEESRPKLPTLTAIETLQFALTAGHVLETAASWGNVRQRFSNIDALRGLVIDYESVCTMQKSAASAGGFISYVERLKNSKRPPSSDENAVQILTYHGAKGLEWPVVILTDLDKSASPAVHKDLCSVAVESDQQEFDVREPLKGRWLRFWPWPYGKQEQGVYLDVSGSNSPEYEALCTKLRAESVRLLYVGVTRARELLIFAPYAGRRGQGSGLEWAEDMQDAEGRRVLIFPQDKDGIGKIAVAGTPKHDVLVKTLVAPSPDVQIEKLTDTSKLFAFQRKQSTSDYPPFILRPSQIAESPPEANGSARTGDAKVIDIGSRIPLTGNADMTVIGDCIHRFLAADEKDLSLEERLIRADRLRELWSVFQITAESMVEMSDRLHAFVEKQFGDCIWHRECPITGRSGNQRIHGVIDLLVETKDAFFIIDHKSFPGGSEKWAEKALTFAQQLHCYRNVLLQASDKSVDGMFIHMPVVGKVIELTSQI